MVQGIKWGVGGKSILMLKVNEEVFVRNGENSEEGRLV